jgi:hypothetical protein
MFLSSFYPEDWNTSFPKTLLNIRHFTRRHITETSNILQKSLRLSTELRAIEYSEGIILLTTNIHRLPAKINDNKCLMLAKQLLIHFNNILI